MAKATIHLKVVTFDPAQGRMIPVPDARVMCEDSSWLWDPNLSTSDATTDGQGVAQMQISFGDGDDDSLNPYFTVELPDAARTVPAGEPAARQFKLPAEWVTRHYERRRIPRILEHVDPGKPVQVVVGLPAKLRIAYSDFHPSGKRNPLALPEDTVRVHLVDYDEFLWIDWLNPDDTMTGVGFDPRRDRVRPVGEDEEYPYFDVWPTEPSVLEGAAPAIRAWIDPPGFGVGALGGGSFEHFGTGDAADPHAALAVDSHGFVFMLDGRDVRRFYPDGTLCETIASFTNPGGLAVDQYRNLYVSDTTGNQVVAFRPDFVDGRTGTYVLSTSMAGLNKPLGLAVVPTRQVDEPELLVVADAGSATLRVFRITLVGPTGAALVESYRASQRYEVSLAATANLGSSGAGAGQFTEPVGVAADRQRRLFACDRALHRVSRWRLDAAGTAGTHEVDWGKAGGTAGAANAEFDKPQAIAVDVKNGFVYVADGGNHRVQRLDAETGAHLANWAPLPGTFSPTAVGADTRGEVYVGDSAAARIVRGTSFGANGARLADGTPPTQVGQPWTPRGEAGHTSVPAYVTFTPEGHLWVADTGNNRVLAFERDETGELVAAAVPPAAGLDKPVGIAFDAEGGLFVVNSGNDRVRRYTPALAHQADLGTSGSAAGQLKGPRGLAVAQSAEPILYVADTGNDRIQKLKRDGTDAGTITTDGTTALKAPEDVAVGADGTVYVADTGNARIVVFGPDDAFRRALTISGGGLSFGVPSGVSVDDAGTLLVTDRGKETVFRLRTDGTVIAYWDLINLPQQQVGPSASPGAPSFFYPEHARLVRFRLPARAALDRRGLLAVADTGHDRVRLVRTATHLDVNLFDLGEGMPDVSFRAVTKAKWMDELGLKLNVGDVSIFDETHDFTGRVQEDFSDDEFADGEPRILRHETSDAINVMRVVRTAQRWYQLNTRKDEAAHRWARKGDNKELGVDIYSYDLFNDRTGGGAFMFLEVNLGRNSTHGKGPTAWDDSVVAHEMAHWVMMDNISPYPVWPPNPARWVRMSKSHYASGITSQDQTMSEGWAEYVELFFGSEFQSTDRVRGFSFDDVSTISKDPTTPTVPRQYLFGGVAGPTAASKPAFDAPGKALASEGYFANCLYQLHHMLAAPDVLFADASSYWHHFNHAVSDAASQRFSDTIWKALRRFKADPPWSDEASGVLLKRMLENFHASHPDLAQTARSLLELNNQLTAKVTITAGTSSTDAGAAIEGAIRLKPGQTKALIVRVTDAAGRPCAGYNLNVVCPSLTAAAFRPAGAGPAVKHGRVPATGLNRATNEHGIVNVVYEAPAAAAALNEQLRATYQPDFDTDATFDPPAKGDDRETTIRRLYLHELRAASKTWAGTGDNFGARTSGAVALEVRPS